MNSNQCGICGYAFLGELQKPYEKIGLTKYCVGECYRLAKQNSTWKLSAADVADIWKDIA